MARPENITVFIPDEYEKERLQKLCVRIINIISEDGLPDYEVAFVLRNLVEGFQQMNKCIIPIEPKTCHLPINLK